MKPLEIYKYPDGSREVNGRLTYAKEFAYDGCHKIYLLERIEHKIQAVEYEYDIYPIEELEEKFMTSCPLRFINSWDLSFSYVKQFELDEEEEEEYA